MTVLFYVSQTVYKSTSTPKWQCLHFVKKCLLCSAMQWQNTPPMKVDCSRPWTFLLEAIVITSQKKRETTKTKVQCQENYTHKIIKLSPNRTFDVPTGCVIIIRLSKVEYHSQLINKWSRTSSSSRGKSQEIHFKISWSRRDLNYRRTSKFGNKQ